METSHILVTGSSGYIAGYLIPHLKSRGYKVTGIDRRLPAHNHVDMFIHGDLFDRNALRRALETVDTVFHLAAAKDDFGISHDQYFRDNFEATRILVEEGKQRDIKKWLFLSTVAAMGPSETPMDEQAALNPSHPYGISKAKAETLFHQLWTEAPANHILIIRPSVVYGIDNYPTTNIYRLIDAIYRNRFFMIGDGRVFKSTSYIENLIAAILFLLDQPRPSIQTYIYIDEPVLQTAELVEKIYRYFQKAQPHWSLPLWFVKPLASVFDALAAVSGINFTITASRIEKFCTPTNFDASAIRQLGFQQPVSNEDALRTIIGWYLSCKQSGGVLI